MPDRPILFSAPMVRALLEGRKTQTRRLAWKRHHDPDLMRDEDRPSPWQRVQPGDRLWVRETWAPCAAGFMYRADYPGGDGWRPSIHMPRRASRLTLTVTAVRVEQLQAISEEDCDAEGFGGEWPHKVAPHLFRDADEAGRLTVPECFGRLWDSLHGPGAWDANPAVVVLTFTVRQGNIDHA